MSARWLILLFATTACGAHNGTNSYVDARQQVVVTPTLSELPDGKRDQVLDSARARPDPEQRRRDLKPRERKLEWGAAVGAAILGQVFSDSPNATVGTEGIFDETGQLQKMRRARLDPDQTGAAPADPATTTEDSKADQLVPWVNVKAAPPAEKPAEPAPQH